MHQFVLCGSQDWPPNHALAPTLGPVFGVLVGERLGVALLFEGRPVVGDADGRVPLDPAQQDRQAEQRARKATQRATAIGIPLNINGDQRMYT